MASRLRDGFKSLQNSNYIVGRIIFHISLFIWSAFKLIVNPRYRSEQISSFRYSKSILQVSTYTIDDRYPKLFQQIADELREIKEPKILSFGCSTGEEVFSLKKLIPNAKITGVDINNWCIKKASKSNPYSDCQFIQFHREDWKNNEKYNCVLALAVMQKSKNRDQSRGKSVSAFQFADFEKIITQLSQLLNPGGFFIIDHSDYQIKDHSQFDKLYIPFKESQIIRSRKFFSSLGDKQSESTTSHRIFIKREA